MNKILAALTIVFLTTSSAFAAPACYSPSEFEAEHLLRLHSELMVITVTCRVGSHGEDLVSAYTGFTQHNINALHGAEQTMINYYDAHGGHGQDNLDVLRTKLGNEFGQKVADVSAQPFCNSYRNKVLAFYYAQPSEIKNEVRKMAASYKPYAKQCTVERRVADRHN